MPAKQNPAAVKKNRARRRTCRVLLVQAEATHRGTLESCGTARRPMSVVHAPTLAEARQYLANHVVDLAVIAPQLPDGSGLELTAEITRMSHTTAKIVIADKTDFSLAQRALRAGADDLIIEGVDAKELSGSVAEALDRKTRDKAHVQRVERLRRLCKKLNAAREEVSKQVDVLCNDLVTAYQELACQMQNVVQSSEFGELVHHELDLEALLRKTLEHLMAKLGPSNAAIFLPATMDEYSLGGYVNYDCTKESADLLLQQLADTLAPKIAAEEDMVYLTQHQEIEHWIGRDAGMLNDATVIAAPCCFGGECLAVLVLFRDVDQPFSEEHLDRVSSLAPLLGESLEKIIRVHHRSVFAEDEADYGKAYEAENNEATDNPFGVDLDEHEDELPF